MSDSDHDRLPRALGKYRLLRLVGRGGMGTVYEAEDTSLRRRVALKLLAGDLAKRPGAAGRFLLEARAAARLNHSHVVTIFEVGRRDETLFIAMELAERGSVAGLLQREGQLPWREAVRIVRDACRGLVAAHAAQLIHRDLKPANLLLMLDGTVKLADFGLVKVLDSDLVDEPTSNRDNSTAMPQGPAGGGSATWGAGELSTWSRTAAFLGTPHYMSPEQCRRDAVTEASDVYSLGATLFALIAGRPPFPGGQPLKVMFAHCGSRPPNLCETVIDVPAACGTVVERCLAKQPHQRFRSATELLAALDELLCEPPAREPIPPPVAMPVALSVPMAPPPPPPLPALAKPSSIESLQSPAIPIASTSNVAPPLHRRFAPTSLMALAFLVPLALVAIVAGLGVLGRLASSWLSADSSRQSTSDPSPSLPFPMATDSKAGQQITAKTKQPTGEKETARSFVPTAVIPTAAAVTALAYSEEGRLVIGESVERGELTDWRFGSPSGGAAESRTLRLTTRLTTGGAIRSNANDGASSSATASVSAIRFARDGRWLAVGVRGGAFNGLHLFERDGDGGWKFVRLVSPFGPSSVAFLERSDSLPSRSPSPRESGNATGDDSAPTPTATTTGESRFATSHVAAVFMDTRREAVVSAWRLPSLELEPTPPLVATPLKAMTAVRGEAPRLVAGGRSGQLFWCDAALPGFVTTATLPAVRCLAASLDGQWVAVGGGAELELWRIDPAGDGAARRRGHAPFVRVGRLKRAAEQLVFSADARFLFVASDDKQEPAIHIIDCATVSTARSIPTPGGAVSVLALSPDGRWLASAGGVQGVAVWDAARLVGGL